MLLEPISMSSAEWQDLKYTRLATLGPYPYRRTTEGVLYQPLSTLRIYPLDERIITGIGRSPPAPVCQQCLRPIRLFSKLKTGPLCSSDCAPCRWKEDNIDVVRLIAFRLWPHDIDLEIQSTVCEFLHCEGCTLSIHRSRNRASLSTPSVHDIFSTAHARSWHSLLLSGVRTTEKVSSPLARPSTSEENGQDGHEGVVARWTAISQLCGNFIWRLVFACYPLMYRRQPLIAGRPFWLLLAFLGKINNIEDGEPYRLIM